MANLFAFIFDFQLGNNIQFNENKLSKISYPRSTYSRGCCLKISKPNISLSKRGCVLVQKTIRYY